MRYNSRLIMNNKHIRHNNPEAAPMRDEHYTRRGILKGAVIFIAGVALGKCAAENNSTDRIERYFKDHDSDILGDPEKMTNYINKYTDLAIDLSKEEPVVPFEVYLAVSMHESDSGTSELVQKANNYFGVIAKDGWEGDEYLKPTEEEVDQSELTKLQKQHGSEVSIVKDYGDGRIRVKYPRPFRKYKNAEESFRDFAKKLYFKNKNGTYRYADAVDYLKEGGRDPYVVIEHMDGIYATGREWADGVSNYIGLIQKVTGKSSAEPNDEPKTLPDKSDKIDIDLVDFNSLDQPRDKQLIDNIKSGAKLISADRYHKFFKKGILDKSDYVLETTGDAEFVAAAFNSTEIKMNYIVWHAWALGVNDFGTKSAAPKGKSHTVKPENLLNSWKNSGAASANYFLLDDKYDNAVWRLTKRPFSKTWHAANGVMDDASATHNVNNSNSIGIEVQADSAYDVQPGQIENLLYFTTKILIESGKIKKGMTRKAVNNVIEDVVVGHGKTGGAEFGQRITSPLKQILGQLAYIAVQEN